MRRLTLQKGGYGDEPKYEGAVVPESPYPYSVGGEKSELEGDSPEMGSAGFAGSAAGGGGGSSRLSELEAGGGGGGSL